MVFEQSDSGIVFHRLKKEKFRFLSFGAWKMSFFERFWLARARAHFDEKKLPFTKKYPWAMIQSDQIRDLTEEIIEENCIGAEYSWENRIRPLMRFYGHFMALHTLGHTKTP